MPFTSHAHIVILAIDDACGATRFVRDQGSHQGRNGGLRLLAAKGASHAFADAHHLVQ